MEARKINKSIKDIEALLKLSIKERNLALTELNLIRLLKLMNYLIRKLELTENYNQVMRVEVARIQQEVDVWEKEFITETAKKNNVYHVVKKRIDETFR
jgi:hypothetical protein